MKLENYTKTVKLDENLIVKIAFRREGQEPTAVSDKVVVVGKILLPTVKDDEYNDRLDDRIRFGKRIKLQDEYLHALWGEKNESGFRSIKKLFAAVSWKEAFQQAEQSIEEELDKLVNAYSERILMLKNAEE